MTEVTPEKVPDNADRLFGFLGVALPHLMLPEVQQRLKVVQHVAVGGHDLADEGGTAAPG